MELTHEVKAISNLAMTQTIENSGLSFIRCVFKLMIHFLILRNYIPFSK